MDIQTFERARVRLSDFVLSKAADKIIEHGFSYRAVDLAPESFLHLRGMWAHCVKTGDPLPVRSADSDNTIYTMPCVNHAFRFWHDCLHVESKRGFSHYDELAIGMNHVFEVCDEFGDESPEAFLMHADTIQQTIHYNTHKAFVVDQLAFVKDVLNVR